MQETREKNTTTKKEYPLKESSIKTTFYRNYTMQRNLLQELYYAEKEGDILSINKFEKP